MEQPVVKQPDKVVETQIHPVPTVVEQQPQPQQPIVNRNVLANFPNINPALTYNHLAKPLAPAQPIAQLSFREKRDTMQSLENLTTQMQGKGKSVIPLPLNVKLVGKLPSFEIELDDKEKWMINEVDRNRVRRQLLNKIKIDEDMVRRLLPKQVNLDKFLENLEHKVIHDSLVG